MKKTVSLCAISISLLMLAGCTYSEATDCKGLEVSDAWVRQAPPGAPAQAGYFEITNSSGNSIILHGVQSTDFGRVEMHETKTVDGSTSMRPIKSLKIPPRTGDSFNAGGKHLMLFEPRLPYVGGDRVLLEFVCGADRAHTPVSAEVRSSEPVSESPTK